MRTRGGGGAELAARSQVCYLGLPGPAERRAGLLRRGQGGQAGRRRVGDVKSRRRSRGAAGLRCCGGKGVCGASGRGWRRRGVRLGLRRAGPGIAGAVGEGNPRWFRRGSRRAVPRGRRPCQAGPAGQRDGERVAAAGADWWGRRVGAGRTRRAEALASGPEIRGVDAVGRRVGAGRGMGC